MHAARSYAGMAVMRSAATLDSGRDLLPHCRVQRAAGPRPLAQTSRHWPRAQHPTLTIAQGGRSPSRSYPRRGRLTCHWGGAVADLPRHCRTAADWHGAAASPSRRCRSRCSAPTSPATAPGRAGACSVPPAARR
jgi:hypothetical protein